MTDRVLTWELPVVTPRQREQKHTVVEFRADPSLPWTIQDTVLATAEQKVEFLDVNAGTFDYQLTIYDIADVAGEPVIVSANLPFEPPGSPLNVTITDI